MKRNLVNYFITTLFLLFFSLSTQVQAAETLTLDPERTYVLWHVNSGFTTQVGKWYASGTLTIDKENPQDSKLNATVDVATLVTGNLKLDKQLKGKLFFDVEQYPTATFVSNIVQLTSDKTANVYGMLTLHGVSMPVMLNVKLNQSGPNPMTDKMTVGFSATTTVKRSDFGIISFLPSISDDVKIDIEAEAYKPSN